jgi:N,N'-diacetyllegionaminate synthase
VAIYLIAEAGINHGGDMAAALELVRAAKAAGADAIKFQSFRADTLAHPHFAADQLEFFRRLELSREAHFELMGACLDEGIDFLSTPFDFEMVDLLCELGVPALKIASGDATHLPLISYAARQGRPLYISTGMCTLAEAADAYYCALEEGAPRVVLLHCTSSYPAPYEDANLAALQTLAGELFCEVGYSDHTVGLQCCLGAAALGAVVIEKHFCLDKNASGPDIAGSCDPAELARLAQHLKVLDLARGDGVKRPMPSELANRAVARRSVVYARDLPGGHVVSADDVLYLRPVIGLSPAEAYRFFGRTLGVDMQAFELASEQDIAVVRRRPADESETGDTADE